MGLLWHEPGEFGLQTRFAALRMAYVRTLVFALVVSTAPSAIAQTPTEITVSKAAASLPGPRYAWIAMPQRLKAEADVRVQDLQLRGRIQSAIDKALQAKGYRLANNASQADFQVAYRVGVRDAESAKVEDAGPDSAPEAAIECRQGGCSQIVARGGDGSLRMHVETTDYVEGGLMVEILEPGQIRVLWRALYKGTVHGPKDGAQAHLDAIAGQTLAQLPKASAPKE